MPDSPHGSRQFLRRSLRTVAPAFSAANFMAPIPAREIIVPTDSAMRGQEYSLSRVSPCGYTRTTFEQRAAVLSGEPIPSILTFQIQQRAQGNNAGRVDVIMRHIIVSFDMVEIDRLGYARKLIEILEVAG